ncbi:MAG: thiol-disulfide isomerase, partial [Nitrosopumilus sp.]|nr:thiol-disulfide isomerase [Nitrosopumilus sp.]
MKTEIKTALILTIIIVIGISTISIVLSTLDMHTQSSDKSFEMNSFEKINKSGFKMAPDLIGIAHYLNTTPEEL